MADLPADPRLLAVDGNSLAHRAYHAQRRADLRAPDGRPVFAVHGFVRLLSSAVRRTRPRALVVGFDDPERNHRKADAAHYKAQRPSRDQDLYDQISEVAQLLTEMGVAVVTAPGWEADDVVATAAARAGAAGWGAVVASSDRDTWQAASDRTVILAVGTGSVADAPLYDADDIEARTGVPPHRWVEAAALRGDVSDNLPGVRGIGERTAAKLLTACTLDQLLDDPLACGASRKQADAVTAAADDVRRNRDLMTARTDLEEVPTPEGVPSPTDADRIAAVLVDHDLPSSADQVATAFTSP